MFCSRSQISWSFSPDREFRGQCWFIYLVALFPFINSFVGGRLLMLLIFICFKDTVQVESGKRQTEFSELRCAALPVQGTGIVCRDWVQHSLSRRRFYLEACCNRDTIGGMDLVDGHQRLPMLLPALHYEPMALGVSAPPAGADAWLLGSVSACRCRAKVLMNKTFLKWIHYWRLLMITVSLLPHYWFITSSLLPHYFLLLQITSIRSGWNWSFTAHYCFITAWLLHKIIH